MGELIALLFDQVPRTTQESDVPLATWVEDRLRPLAEMDPPRQRDALATWWNGLPRTERFILNKLLSGEFRVGVAQTLIVRSLAEAAGTDATQSRPA